MKSVLLVDFDSLHRSLTAGGGEAAARLAMKVPGWVAGLQSGRLIGPDERTFVAKRCYADPKTIGEARHAFATAGFKLVDCATTSAGRGVDLMIAMDAMEHLADHEPVEEYVLLSGEPTLAPLLTRLKAKDRRTAIYADTVTGQAYRALADSVLDIAAFAEFLLTHDPSEAAASLAADRSEIEALARRIHAATNIPLFSPRTFAELFRLLAEEIVANGYHFQTTAKNVADKLSESGRSVTRRQVVFIVKGLALKGHVFSTTDSPRKLAEVFREQAHYLIENAGLKLEEQQERVLSAWLVDRASNKVPRTPAAAAPQPASAAPTAANGSRPASQAPGEHTDGTPAPPIAKTEAARRAPREPAEPRSEKAMAAAPMDEAAPSPSSPREAVRQPTAERPAPPSTLPARMPRTPGAMITPDDARAAIAAKIAASVRPKPAARAAAKSVAPPAAEAGTSAAPAPSPGSTSNAAPEHADGEPKSIENSILAAIAEAVDVLVEDGEPEEAGAALAAASPPVPARKRPPPAPPASAARPAIERSPARERTEAQTRPARPRAEPRRLEGDDIGDEIQRIIATYNRNRKDEPQT